MIHEFPGLEIRHVRPDEREALIRFWLEHFPCSYECFARVFEQPWYRDADCLIAVDAEGIAASVYAERRTYEWFGNSFVCAAIGEVVTANRWRRRGVSSALLSRSIGEMERDGVACSLLMTGIPALYAKLGWESISLPRLKVRASASGEEPLVSLLPVEPLPPAVERLYEGCPHRRLHFPRPSVFFTTYAAWSWRFDRKEAAFLLVEKPGAGYGVVSLGEGEKARLEELRAADLNSELAIIHAACQWAVRRNLPWLSLGFMPQFVEPASLPNIEPAQRADYMIRRVGMPKADYEAIKASLADGSSTLWDADEF